MTSTADKSGTSSSSGTGATTLKLLVSGPLLSTTSFTTLQSRVKELQASKHGPFAALLVLGAQSSWPTDLDLGGLPRLVLDGTSSRIVQFQGIAVGLVPESAQFGIVGHVDVLLTALPPRGFHRVLPGSLPPYIHTQADLESIGSSVVSASAELGRPKYHFCAGLSCFYQRPPYDNGEGVTRLISLASVGDDAKPSAPELKWLHALNLPLFPQSKTDAAQPGVTPNPYLAPAERQNKRGKTAEDASSSTQFFFAAAPKPSSSSGPMRRPKVPPRMDCWFCLASPSCEKHLIAAIGEEMYIALPKGGMQIEHALIVTITHEVNFACLSSVALDEVAKHQDQIVKLFAKRGYACMFSERSIILGKAAHRHCYMEALPVPASALGKCEEAVMLEASKGRFKFEPLGRGAGASNRENLAALGQSVAGADSEYVYIQLPGGKALLHRVQPVNANEKAPRVLPMQIARAAACNLLDKPELIQWKNCVAPVKVEEAWTAVIKAGLGN